MLKPNKSHTHKGGGQRPLLSHNPFHYHLIDLKFGGTVNKRFCSSKNSKWTWGKARVLSLLFVPLLVTGCKLPLAPGKYSSRLTLVSSTPGVGQTVQSDEPVRVEITPIPSGLSATILDFKSMEPKYPAISVTRLKRHHLALTVPFLDETQAFDLTLADPKSADACYQWSGKATEISSVELCFNEEWFRLHIKKGAQSVLRLSGNHVEPRIGFEASESVSLTLRQALDILFTQGFDVQEAQQNLVRADRMAQKTYLKLLPHTSLGTPVTMASVALGDYFEARGPIGELIPFIFPTRWVKAKALSWSARAERYAKVATKANALLALNIAGINFAAHKEYRDALLELQGLVNSAVVSTPDSEAGSSDDSDAGKVVSTMVSLLKKDLQTEVNTAENLIQQDQVAISYALGSENPKYVSELGLVGTKRVESISVLRTDAEAQAEVTQTKNLAIQFSLELSQVDALFKAADLREKNVWIDWFDSYSNIGLGPSTPTEKKYYKSFVDSVRIKEQAARALIPRSASAWTAQRNMAVMNYFNHLANRQTQREQLNVVVSRRITHPSAAADLRNAVKGSVAVLSALYSSRALAESKQAELDRLTRSGIYEYLSPHLGEQPVEGLVKNTSNPD